METLLIVVIALGSALGLVLLLSLSSIFFVHSKYTALRDLQREEEEEQQKGSLSSSTYVPHSVYAAKVPKIDDVSAYQKLEENFLRDPGGTTQMTEAFHPHAMDEVAQALVVLFEANDQADVLIRNFIDLEMNKASEAEGPTTLFRRDSVASKVMRFYSKLVGQQYLISVLWPNIRQVCLTDDQIEIDINRMKKEDDLEDHLTSFQEILANFLEAIVNSVPLCPPQIRAICHHLNTKANQFFPDNNLKVVSGFIFLRFFTPAIICPNAYGIVEGDLTPNQSRTLLLVAKVLQNLANGILFGAKEQFMMPLNEFLTANTPLVKGFLAELAQPDSSIPSLKAFSVSTDSKFTALRVLHSNLVRSYPKFKREAYPFLYDKTQIVLRDLSDEGKRVSSRPYVNTGRRVSVSLLRADSGQNSTTISATPSTGSQPEKSVSLQSITVATTPRGTTTYSNLPLPNDDFDIPGEVKRKEIPQDVDEDRAEVEGEIDEQEEREEDESEEDAEGALNESAEQHSDLAHSATSLIPPSTFPSSSPNFLLPKSKSGASIPKSKSGNSISPAPAHKKKKNRNIPNERLYRPSSASKASTSSTSLLSSSPSSPSPSLIRPTSPMKSGRVPSTASPKLSHSFSPSPTRPAALGDLMQPAPKLTKTPSSR